MADLVARARLFAALPGNTLAAAAARYGLPLTTLRRARPVTPTLDDLLLHALSPDHPTAAAELVGWLDHVDHAVYTPAEIEARLQALSATGVVTDDGGWIRAADWP